MYVPKNKLHKKKFIIWLIRCGNWKLVNIPYKSYSFVSRKTVNFEQKLVLWGFSIVTFLLVSKLIFMIYTFIHYSTYILQNIFVKAYI